MEAENRRPAGAEDCRPEVEEAPNRREASVVLNRPEVEGRCRPAAAAVPYRPVVVAEVLNRPAEAAEGLYRHHRRAEEEAEEAEVVAAEVVVPRRQTPRHRPNPRRLFVSRYRCFSRTRPDQTT